MNDDAPPPGLRGKPLLLARTAALTVSIGVLVLLMARAGGGCRSDDALAVAEPRPAAPSATARPLATAPSLATTPAASASARPKFFPGSKSFGGDIVDPPQDQH
jgi:hypothetical protein